MKNKNRIRAEPMSIINASKIALYVSRRQMAIDRMHFRGERTNDYWEGQDIQAEAEARTDELYRFNQFIKRHLK